MNRHIASSVCSELLLSFSLYRVDTCILMDLLMRVVLCICGLCICASSQIVNKITTTSPAPNSGTGMIRYHSTHV